MTPSDDPLRSPGSSDPVAEAPTLRSNTIALRAIIALAGLCLWRPVETFPSTAVVIAATVLALAVWGWRRTQVSPSTWLAAAAVVGVIFAAGLSGADPASAVKRTALLVAVVSMVWLASRAAPPERWPAVLALAVSGLAVWGVWQVAVGFEQTAAVVEQLPADMREAAAERLASGRAFASQLLPSHLAVLFATALPLLIARLRLSSAALPWAVGSILCVVGLVLTRSPIGSALALIACVMLALARRGRSLRWVAGVLTVVLAVVVVGRGDVLKLEPVSLRLDNWQTAVWVWSTAPAAGVGTGGFAQAAQGVPFEVGNRPVHAHSLPLELLAELGPIGLVAFFVAAFALWRVLRSLWFERPDLAVALAVIPVHNLVDFSIFGSGVAVPWAVLLGWAATSVNRPSAEPAETIRGRVVLVAAATAMLAATILHVTSIAVEDAAASRDIPIERLEGAVQARRLAPWRVVPLGLAAGAALESGDPEHLARAISELDRARWLRPRSALGSSLRARLAAAANEAPRAVSEAWAAAVEQPSNPTHAELLEDLLHRLDAGARR